MHIKKEKAISAHKTSSSGNYNSGNQNSGDYNSGNYNSSSLNSGDYNSGNQNSGDYNSGWSNSGHQNSGDCNSGSYNSGDYNSGWRNSGNWNSGNWNNGYFNTHEHPQIFCFNKLTNKIEIDFPDFLYFELVEWIPVRDMTDDEKNSHPEYAVIGGYLKKKNYKEAFRESFKKAKEKPNWPEELEKLRAIPNFDPKIFEEISGIHPEDLE